MKQMNREFMKKNNEYFESRGWQTKNTLSEVVEGERQKITNCGNNVKILMKKSVRKVKITSAPRAFLHHVSVVCS